MARSVDIKGFTCVELSDLSGNARSARDVLDFLVDHEDRTEASLNSESYDAENRMLILHILWKASTCRTSPENVIQLLSVARYSWFMKVGITSLLNINGDNDTLCSVIREIVELIDQFSVRLRSVVLETMGLLTVLKETIHTLLPDLESPLQNNMIKVSESVANLQDEIVKMWMKNNDTKSRKRTKEDNLKLQDDMHPPEDFRKIPILPRLSDIFLSSRVFLRANKTKGKYKDLYHYLDVQFRLYREDCIRALREGITEYIGEKSQGKDIRRLQDGRLYKHVTAREVENSVEGLLMEIKLDKEQASRIQWRNSQRLIYGSLVCLSADHFQTMVFAVVAESDRMELDRKRTFKVHMATRQKCQVGVDLTMVESTAYFEAYKHVLTGLQNIHDGDLPFEKYIVRCSSDVDSPKYLQDGCKTYDLYPNIGMDVICKRRTQTNRYGNRNVRATNKNDQNNIRNVKILSGRKYWPSPEELHLDESQFRAFHSALTEEFVLIQGPPGTGKTYVGLQIAKALLHNESVWRERNENDGDDESSCPMLVVCFTNHALDQFVEGIIDFHDESNGREWKDGIVRVGGRCQSEKVEPYSLKYKRRYRGRHFVDEKSFFNRIEQIRFEIALASRRIQKVKSTVLSLQHLKEYMTDNDFNQFMRVANDRMRKDFAIFGMHFPKEDYENKAIAYWLHVSEDGWTQRALEALQYEIFGQSGDFSLSTSDGVCAEDTIEVPTVAQDAENDRRIEEDDVDIKLPDENMGVDIQNLIGQILLSYQGQYIREDLKVLMKNEAAESLSRLSSQDTMSTKEAQTHIDLQSIPTEDRWRLYRHWVNLFCGNQRTKIEALREQEKSIYKEYQREKQEIDARILKKSKVIAMTTTGAARYHDVLREVGPRIIIVEEAAEVLEAHIITCLSAKCEHLILIGDHKQLEPKPSVYELEVKYNLGVSMFERMLNNGLSFHCLQRQHRMRPDISHLLRHIYPDLVDNDNVKEYGNVLGMSENLFFVTHTHPEQYKDGVRSYSNEHEAMYIMRLCKYLLLQGYKPSQITVLAAYNGQMFCIRNFMPRDKFDGVKVSAIDNYQGEENDIILVSLVRSNGNRNIGFLKRENRVCVALSRARKGMYIVGNSTILEQSSTIWRKIIADLKATQRLQTSLPLYCQIHPDRKLMARTGSDFDKAPEGGCNMKCDFRLPCGHACRLYCHPKDREHTEYQCQAICKKTCPNGHVCQKKCHFTTACKCPVIMNKTLPCLHKCKLECSTDPNLVRCEVIVRHILQPCEHEAEIQCFMDPKTYDCKVKVTKQLPRCTHTAQMECSQDPKEVQCRVIVDRELTCRHKATMECHVDAKTYNCTELVRYTRACNHSYELECFKSSSKFEMANSCRDMITKTWDCGHSTQLECCNKDKSCEFLCLKTCINGHTCIKQCHYPLGCKCIIEIPKSMPDCGHEKSMPCYKDPAEDICETVVTKTFPVCKHKIEMKCCEDISNRSCKTLVDKTFPRCKHTMPLRCFDDIRRYVCKAEVMKVLPCSHEKQMKCCDSVSKVKCDTNIEKKFPDCTHTMKLRCSDDIRRYVCRTEVVKELPCSHKKPMQCCHPVNKVKCDVMVQKQFPDCKHTIMLMCSEDIFRHVCSSKVVKKLPCSHEKRMKCCDSASTAKCKVEVEKTFPVCKHTMTLRCNDNIRDYICHSEVLKKLPCSHERRMKCSDPVSNAECDAMTERKFPDCEHTIEIKCNEDISRHICRSEVVKMLPCYHMRKMKCCDSVNKAECDEIVEKIMPGCGHTKKLYCRESIDGKKCRKKVMKTLPCGHSVEVMCCDTDLKSIKCKQQLLKPLPFCGHKANVKCFENLDNIKCTADVSITLPDCGHKVQGKCFQDPRIESYNETAPLPLCREKVDKVLPCRHTTTVKCTFRGEIKCSSRCSKVLSCGHTCTGLCTDCFESGLHAPCKTSCSKTLICGHPCQSSSCGECKPCEKQCTVYCPHGVFNIKCTETYRSCCEPCTWSCPHFKCTKTCSEICDRPKCEERCPKKLRCGHQCLGFCGEPCPRTCKVCHTKKLNNVTGIRDISTLDVYLVRLLECHHEFAAEDLDGMFESLKVNRFPVHPRCPACSSLIKYHPRYGNLLKQRKREQMYVQSLMTDEQCHYPIVKPNFKEIVTYVELCCTFMYPQQRLIEEEDVELRSLSLSTISETKRLLNILNTVLKNQPREQAIHDGYSLMYNLAASWIMFIASNSLKKPKRQDNDSSLDDEKPGMTDGERALQDAKQIFEEFSTHNPESVKQMESILRLHVHYRGLLEAALRHPVFEGVIGNHTEDWNVCQEGHVEPSSNHRQMCIQCNMGREPHLGIGINLTDQPESVKETEAGKSFPRNLQHKPPLIGDSKEKSSMNAPGKCRERNNPSHPSEKDHFMENRKHRDKNMFIRRQRHQKPSDRGAKGAKPGSRKTEISSKEANLTSNQTIEPKKKMKNLAELPESVNGTEDGKTFLRNSQHTLSPMDDLKVKSSKNIPGKYRERNNPSHSGKGRFIENHEHTDSRRKRHQKPSDTGAKGPKHESRKTEISSKEANTTSDQKIETKKKIKVTLPVVKKEIDQGTASNGFSLKRNTQQSNKKVREPRSDGELTTGLDHSHQGGNTKTGSATHTTSDVGSSMNSQNDTCDQKHDHHRQQDGRGQRGRWRCRGQKSGRGRDPGTVAKKDTKTYKDPTSYRTENNENGNGPQADSGQRGRGRGPGHKGGQGREHRTSTKTTTVPKGNASDSVDRDPNLNDGHGNGFQGGRKQTGGRGRGGVYRRTRGCDEGR